MLESNTVTEVFPLNFGGGGVLPPEPQPVVNIAARITQEVIREAIRALERADEVADFIIPPGWRRFTNTLDLGAGLPTYLS